MKIRELRTDNSYDEVAYDALLSGDAGNLIYATTPFLKFIAAVTSAQVTILVAENERGIVVGALAYAVCEAIDVGCVVNSLPWWGSHGSVVLDRSRADADEIRTSLLRRFIEIIERLQPLSTTMILLPAEEPARAIYEALLQPSAFDSRIGQFTLLPSDGHDLEVRLQMAFKQKTRNLVRKGLNQGFVELVTDEPWAWDFLHSSHVVNIEALGGRAKPRSHFEALKRSITPAMRRLSVAMDGATPVAAMLTLAANATVEYVTPTVELAHRSRQPLSFLIFRGMMDAVRRGERVWNWGGTWHGQPALHHFKAGFGATDRPYSYLTRASAAGLDRLRERRQELTALFPYFYTYPYAALDCP